MKSSALTTVQQLIKIIEETSLQMTQINACSAVRFSENNHMDEQIRVTYSMSDAVGSKIKDAVLCALQQRKEGYIKQLQDYGVEYDGK